MKTQALRAGILLAVCWFALPVEAKTPTVITQEASAQAAIRGNDEADATKRAQQLALREAVQQVAGIMLRSDTVVANSTLLADTITAHTAGYIRSYEVIKTERKGSVMEVTVKAQVGRAELDKDLQAVRAMVKSLASRRLVVVIQEQTLGADGKSVIASDHVQTAVSEAFRKDGWTVLDPHAVAGKLELSSGVALGTPDAKRIADLSKADFVVYGTASFQEEKINSVYNFNRDGQVLFPVQGQVSLSMFATDSGTQIAQSSVKLSSGGPEGASRNSYVDETAKLTTREASNYLAPLRQKVLERLRDDAVNGRQLALSVEGLEDFNAVQAFRRAMSRAIDGVNDVTRGNYAKGKADFDVTFVGSSEDFASRLGAARFKGQKVRITGVTGNTVTARVGR